MESDSIMLYDKDNGNTHVLNSVGKQIIEDLDGKTKDEVVQKMRKIYTDIDSNKLKDDINNYLELLIKSGVLYEK